jgi:hypothetical protein
MINPSVYSFVQKTNLDPELRLQVANLDVPGLIVLAARLGYHFNQDELISTLKSIAFDEITEEDLEQIAGGFQDLHNPAPSSPSLGAFSKNSIIAVLIGL